MGIGGILKRLPASTLRKAWRAAHAIAESRSMEDLAQAVFHEVNRIVPHETAVVYWQDPLTLAPVPNGFFLKNIDGASERIQQYNSHYFHVSPVLRTVGDPHYHNLGFTECDIVKKAEFLNSEYYTDFFKPMGLLHTMVLNMAFQGKTVGTLSFHRPPGSRDYSEREKASLTLIAPLIAGSMFASAARAGVYQPASAGVVGVLDPFRLSRREEAIVRLVAQGLSNKEIGDRLFISERTVKTHMTSILRKTGERDRMKLIATLTRQGR